MRKITERTLEALVRLQESNDFQEFKTWIDESAYDATVAAVGQAQPERAWCAGQACCLLDLAGVMKEARTRLEILRTPRDTRRPV